MQALIDRLVARNARFAWHGMYWSERLLNMLGPVYTLMNKELSWSGANAACLAKGLQLASVHSASENKLLVAAAAGNTVWIGGTHADLEDTWRYSSTGTPLLYKNWHSGEPNNAGGNEHCLQLAPIWSGKWNDAPCTQQRKYVCENAPPPVYTLMNEALSWSDASAACLAANLQLASVRSASENALLVTTAAGNSVWIGGTDKDSEGMWTWSPSGTPLPYTNWAGPEYGYGGQPDNFGDQDCLAFNWGSPGLWDDAACTLKKKYVCQNAPPPAYTLVRSTASWHDAKAGCRQRGMQLASVHSEAENALLVAAAKGEKVWIGGTDEDIEDTWKWSSTGTVLSYRNWASGEPNNKGGEHCLQTKNEKGEWNDEDCNDPWWYVCERRGLVRGWCAQPADWCTHGGATNQPAYCGGLPGHFCRDNSGNSGFRPCDGTTPAGTGWPNGACPYVLSSTWMPPLGLLNKVSVRDAELSRSTPTTYVASNCIDGNFNNICHSEVGESSPSLTLDLGTVRPIAYVAVYNRADCCQERLGYYTISYRVRSSDQWTVCSDETAVASAPVPLVSMCLQQAQYVRVQLPGDNRILNLAEVEVYSLNKVSVSKPELSRSTPTTYVASNCIDGNFNNFCHSEVGESSPSLTLDLGTVRPIAYVAVYNRADCCQERLGYYTISYRVRSSDQWTVCSDETAVASAPVPLVSMCLQQAQYVRVQLPGDNRILNLAEVEVYSLPRRPSLRITTGATSYFDGTLDVGLDDGSGFAWVRQTGTTWAKGSTVLDKSYATLLELKVRNPTIDGWVGAIEYSYDGGQSYTPFVCVDCTGGTNAAEIFVDGDDDGGAHLSRCVNGRTCSLRTWVHVRITTGASGYSDGTLDVGLDDGSGFAWVRQTGTTWAKGSTVLDKSYATLLELKVRNPTIDGWVGAIEYSYDGGQSYTPFVCVDCTGGTNAAEIFVDGDDNGWEAHLSRCVNTVVTGRNCSLRPIVSSWP